MLRIIWIMLILFIMVVNLAWADSAGERETLALQTCLTDHPNAEHLCFNVPFYTCMGGQLPVAANPEIAKKRCLFQELFVWGDLIENACNELKSIFEPGTKKWDSLCFDNNSPNWNYLTKEIMQPDRERGLPNYSLRLSVGSTRSFAVQIRMILASYKGNK